MSSYTHTHPQQSCAFGLQQGDSEGPGSVMPRLSFQLEPSEKKVKMRVTQSCPPLCNPMTRLLCPWKSPSKSTGMDAHSLLQGIFPTQGSNRGLLHSRQILYRLSHQESLVDPRSCLNLWPDILHHLGENSEPFSLQNFSFSTSSPLLLRCHVY